MNPMRAKLTNLFIYLICFLLNLLTSRLRRDWGGGEAAAEGQKTSENLSLSTVHACFPVSHRPGKFMAAACCLTAEPCHSINGMNVPEQSEIGSSIHFYILTLLTGDCSHTWAAAADSLATDSTKALAELGIDP